MPSRVTDLRHDRRRAARPSVLRAGGLVAIPTETVYGLGADAATAGRGRPHLRGQGPAARPPADRPPAPARARSTVGRRRVPDRRARAASPTPAGRDRSRCCCPRAARVLDVVTGGRPTVGLRVPAHPLTLRLIGTLGTGLAAPSANRFGHVSPTTAEHVLDDLGRGSTRERDAVLDGGPCPVGVESTIVDCTTSPPQVLRAGAIGAEDVESILASTGRRRRQGRAAPAGCSSPTTHPDARSCSSTTGTRPTASSTRVTSAAIGSRARPHRRPRDRRPRALRRPPRRPTATASTRWWSCCRRRRARPRPPRPLVQGRSRESPISSQSSELSAGDPGVADRVEVGGRDAVLGADA